MLTDMIQNFLGSQIERILVRPALQPYSPLINKSIWWEQNPIAIDMNWILQRNRIYKRILRLVEENKKSFVGWSIDESFLLNELIPLYTMKTGCINIKANLKDKVVRFAHLSDLHICWKKNQTIEGDLVNDLTLKQLNISLEKQNLDFVIVTGDITDNGLGYMKFYNSFKNFIEAGKMIIIPGNHDLNKLGFTAITSAFKNNDFQEFSRITMGHKNKHYVVDAGDILLIGIDSSGSERSNFINNSIGYVNEWELSKLSQIIYSHDISNTKKHKILMIHHPIERTSMLEYGNNYSRQEAYMLRLSNADRILSFCKKNNINLVLQGHEHLSYNILSKKVEGLKIFSEPSSIVSKMYHTIEINKNSIERSRVNF